jgi:DNA-directed RNA polymerase specialized sigma24 family protein
VSSDGQPDLKVSMPRELGGTNGRGAKPEQLFASRHEACEEPMRDFIAATHEPCAERDDREWIGAALAQLSVDQRTALELFYHFGHSREEIAERVHCPAMSILLRSTHS